MNILKTFFAVDGVDFNALLFPDNQITIFKSEDKLQEAIYKLSQAVRKYDLNIFSKRAKVIIFAIVEQVTVRIIVDGKTIEQVSTFMCLDCFIHSNV
jgi:hypothetical protein